MPCVCPYGCPEAHEELHWACSYCVSSRSVCVECEDGDLDVCPTPSRTVPNVVHVYEPGDVYNECSASEVPPGCSAEVDVGGCSYVTSPECHSGLTCMSADNCPAPVLPRCVTCDYDVMEVRWECPDKVR